ncbi:hypothetical protein [Nocardioides daphniae]|uniref:DUF732 domain-containing protein n=1 Tax=Nocardioides daphniae TaxID=402297 RepID=A0A4P7UG25_9ACTN|nr:hypothetical protein [Nocardioides daphniae]QCC78341.1 hypothetical protein E2C04_16130 [Nocardioides daphniae]GGD13386.1 hypothetical protein GCM10007231_10530 [Nocardioides daphniae]
MKLRIRSLALVPVVALVLTACGGASEEEYVDAMSSGLTSAETQPLTKPKAECVSERFVGRMGTDRLADDYDAEDFERDAAQLTFEDLDLTEPEANELFDDFIDCGADMRGRVIAALGDSELALPEGMMDCLKGKITEGQMRNLFVPLMRTGKASLDAGSQKKLEKSIVTCYEGLIQNQG